jgi:hypothetical protein
MISSAAGAPDTAGTTRRTLSYAITPPPAADTVQTFYSFMGLLGSADTVYRSVSARWNFNPLNWITFGSQSITNVTSLSIKQALSAHFVKLVFKPLNAFADKAAVGFKL